MKRSIASALLALLIILTAFAPSVVHAQTQIQYTKLGRSATGLGGDANITTTNHAADSIWNVLLGTGKISGVEIYQARMLRSGGTIGSYQAGFGSKNPYSVSAKVERATVTDSSTVVIAGGADTNAVTLPTGTDAAAVIYPGTLRTFNLATDTVNTERNLVTFPIGAGDWADGQMLQIQSIMKYTNTSDAQASVQMHLYAGSVSDADGDLDRLDNHLAGFGPWVGSDTAPQRVYTCIYLVRVDTDIYVLANSASSAQVAAPGGIAWGTENITSVLPGVDFASGFTLRITIKCVGADPGAVIVAPVASRAIKL